ncbi:MAG: MMPL family transporter [Fibrobacterales bacterium]
MASKIDLFAQRYIAFAERFRFLIIFIALILFAATGYYTFNNLKINNDLSVLLPQDTPSVLALNESNERFGSSDKFIIVIQNEDPQYVATLQKKVKEIIDTEWNDIAISSNYERDNSFFVDHALLYLPVPHLERIRDNLETIQGRMGRKAGPLIVNLFEDSEEDEEELVWFDASLPDELGLPDEAATAFEGYYNTDEKKRKQEAGEEIVPDYDPKAELPTELKTHLLAKSKGETVFNGLVLVKLNQPPTNINFTTEVLAKASTLIDSMTVKNPGIRMSVEGSYEGLKQVKEMKSDGITSAIISILLIFGLVIFFFRSFLSALLLLAQVSFASGIMLFFTTIVYGELNNYTLFVAAIILGMGIDFSIHVMGNVQRFQNDHPTLNAALANTISHLLYPMFLAALTTVAGMLTLLIAEFNGFYEFGVITATGIALSFITAILGLPVLVMTFGGLNKRKPTSFFPSHWGDSQVAAFMKKAAITVIILTAVLAIFIPYAEFENDFRNLRPKKSTEKVEESKPRFRYGDAMSSKRKSSQPAAVLGDSREDLDRLYDTLMVRKNISKDPYLKSFLTLKTFVPEEGEQEDRMEMVEEIAELINARAFSKVTGEDSAMVVKLRGMVDVSEFTAKDIPEWAIDALKEKDGSIGSIGFIYGKYNSWDANDMKVFQDKYAHWNFGNKDLRVFSSAFITADVIEAVKSDSFKMAIFISIVIFLTLSLSLRNTTMVIISFCSLGFGALWTMGLMGLTNSAIDLGKVCIFNVIVIPTALGVGIDSTIHLLVAFVKHRDDGIKTIMDTTGKMVIASSLTTIAGFVGVLFINHRGMRTIGELAVIGIIAALITSLCITPYLSHKFLGKKN